MVNQKVESVGVEFEISVPSTVEEFDELAKKPGTCLEQANRNILYRGVLANFRNDFTEALQKKTGIPRLSEPGKAKKDGTPGEDVYTESEAKYVARVLAETKTKVSDFADVVVEVLAAKNEDGSLKISFDPSVQVRESKPKTLAKMYLEAADGIIAKGGTFEKSSAKLAAKLGHPVEATREGIAAAIKEVEDAARQERANEYV